MNVSRFKQKRNGSEFEVVCEPQDCVAVYDVQTQFVRDWHGWSGYGWLSQVLDWLTLGRWKTWLFRDWFKSSAV